MRKCQHFVVRLEFNNAIQKSREKNMKKMTSVLISILVLVLGLFLLFNDSADKNTSEKESNQSKMEVSADKHVMKYDVALEPAFSNYSSATEGESQQLSQEQQDILMDELIIDFWDELGLSDDASLEEKRISLGIFNRPYMKTITESEYFQLSPEDQEKAMVEVVELAQKTRSFVKDVIAEAQSCIANRDYARAEACLLYAWEVGREFTTNKEVMYITRMVGISFEKDALNELTGLYSQLGDDSKVHSAKGRLSELDAEVEEMRKTARQFEAAN
jgi:hypothetical protein